jgi:hypothetical protein
VKTKTRFFAPLLAAAAMGAAISLAPVAPAEAGAAGTPQAVLQKVAAPSPVTPDPGPAGAAARVPDGSNPLVPNGPTTAFNTGSAYGDDLAS